MLRIECSRVEDVSFVRCMGSIACEGLDLEHLKAATYRSSHGVLLVDIAAVETIDPAGIALLLGVHDRAKSRGGMLIILNPNSWVEEIFRMTHLDTVLRILPTHDPRNERVHKHPKAPHDHYHAVA